MVARNFSRCLALTLRHEGGYSDHPADPGGATNLGITRAVLAEWRGRPVTRAEVRALQRSEAEVIYRRLYWDAVGGDELPAGIDLAVFDYAVNSGVDRAVRTLQRILGLAADGIAGVDTIRAARAARSVDVIRAICAARRGFLGRLKTFFVFGRGWLRRVEAIERLALSLAADLSGAPLSSAHQSQPQESSAMNGSKSLIESRTVWANVIGLAAFGAGLLGVDVGGVDQSAVVDSVLKVVTGASFIASMLFRIGATRKIV
ncbi:MAG TPA: glycosyl hydrolase 108 family protein [Beijerinckiaceae bacterium]|nr:glycosyl hydrolase 108 family protein [Beijerinckiaceae bacterium]